MRDYLDALRLFNRNVRLFMVAVGVHGFAFFGIYSLLLNLYLIRLGYGPEFIGFVNGLGPLMLAVFSLPAGAVSRRLGSRRVMMGGYFVTALSFGLMPLSELAPEAARQAWIAGIYALGWVAGAFIIVNFSPYLMAWTGEKERNYAFAIQAAMFPVAGFVGSLVGGLLPGVFAGLAGLSTESSPIPYRNALLVAAAVDLLAVAAVWRMAEGSGVADEEAEQQVGSSPPYRLMFLFGLITVLYVSAEWTVRVYYNVYLDTVLMTPTALIGGVSAGALLMGLAALFSPQAMARWGDRRLILFLLFFMPLAFLPLIFVAHWLAVGLGYMMLLGAISLMSPVYLVFTQNQVETQWRTAISSSVSMSIGLGVAMTSLAGGSIVSAYNFQTLFVLGAFAPLGSAVLFWWFFRSRETAASGPAVAPDA